MNKLMMIKYKDFFLKIVSNILLFFLIFEILTIEIVTPDFFIMYYF